MKKHIVSQKGQQIVQVALLLPVLLAFLGLVIDVGNIYLHHRLVQNAADAAASAAGMVLYQDGSSVATSTAYYYAAQYGYDNDGVTNIVQVSVPPTSGPYAGNSHYIQVQIQDNISPIFAAIVWNGTLQVGARATAGYAVTGLGPPVIVLEENDDQTMKVTGSALITVNNGTIHINSHGSRALNVTGSAIINTQTPIEIVGGYRIVGSVIINPTPVTGASVLPDPLANLPVPDFASYPVRHGTASHPDTLRITGSGSVTLDPGVYYGGIAITGSNNVTLNPGVYIMAGSGFKITGSARVTGNHVFMYVTEDPSHTSGDGKMGELKLAGSQQLTLTAPDSGDYAGILYFQDRSNDNDVDITGSSMLSGSTGVIYIHAGRLNVTGSADVHLNFVVNKIRFTGSTILTVEGYQGPGWTAVTSALTE